MEKCPDTLKLILLSFVYSIIPLLVFFIVAFATGLFSSLANVESLTESEMLQLMMGYLITVLVSLIVGVIFTILMIVAMARFAHYDSLSQAFEFREVYNDIKKIGIGKIIVWYIVIGIVFGLMTRLGLLFVLLPVVGIVIYLIIILPIAFLFYAYSIGLLYSDIAESDSQNIIENEPVKQIDSKFA